MKRLQILSRSLLAAFLALALCMPQFDFLFGDAGKAYAAESLDPAKDIDFNLFEEVGEIPDSFVAQAEEIIRENWEDTYFSSIGMTLGEQEMTVDGRTEQLSTPATETEDELLLPIVDIAEAAGALVRADDTTGDITVEDDGRQSTVERSSEAARQADSPEDAAPRIESIDNAGEPSALEESIVTEDGIITKPNGESGITTEVPMCTTEEAEKMLNLEIHRAGNRLTITKPYQLKQIILYAEGSLQDTHGAERHVTRENSLHFLQYASEEQTKEAFEAFKSSEDVKYLELNGVVASTALRDRWGSERISADPFKEHLKEGGKTDLTTVAVVDTGVDVSHPFLQGRTVAGYDFVNDDDDPHDDDSHGTHVAGTVVDCTPENVKIVPVKVLGADGRGTELSVVLGIKYAADKGADVVNLSLSGGCSDDACLIEQAVDYAEAKGALTVAAAGNDSQDTALHCPARLDNVITVAALDTSDKSANFSNYGDAVDIAAPGVYIESSVSGGGYERLDGTSMATPHVSAAAAMIALEHPSYAPGDLREAVRATTVDLGEPGWDRIYGAGALDFRILLGVDVPVSGVFFDRYPSTLVKGYSEDLACFVEPFGTTDKSIAFTSRNESVAVCSGGKVFGKGVGTAVIAATTTQGATATCTVNVVESDVWIDYAADSYAGGSGIQGDPYLIATPEQLAKLARDVERGNYYKDEYFKLTADIDLSGKLWASIIRREATRTSFGSIIDSYYFQGSFDGGHHSVFNMKTIDASRIPASTREGSGLFGGLGDPSDISSPKRIIQNLAIIKADVVNSGTWVSSAGILSGGTASKGTVISNCYTNGKVSGSGLIASGRATIVNCFSTADVYAPNEFSRVGGLVGYFGGVGFVDRKAFVANSYAAGNIIDEKEENAGFVSNIGSADISNAFAAGYALYGSGFARLKPMDYDPSIKKSYYLSDNPVGVKEDSNPDITDLEPRNMEFFKDPATYVNPDNWDGDHLWDFENVWAIDSGINGGLPYLKTLPLPPDPPADVAVGEVTLTKESLTIEVDESETLIPVVWPQNAADREVVWQSSDTSVVTVEDGRVSAMFPGSADIIVTTRDGGKTAVCAVTVVPSTPPYVLTVVGGVGTGNYKKGRTVGIVADVPPEGYHFSHWSTDDPGITFADPASMRTTLTTSGRTATVTAVFVPGYRLSVSNGRGSGFYGAGETVNIYTEKSTGKDPTRYFSHWSSSDSRVVFADPEAVSTSFVMPSKNVAVTATFMSKPKLRVQHALDGDYEMNGLRPEGKTINLDIPATRFGVLFTHWTADDPGVVFSDPRSSRTTFTMPNKDLLVKAHYEEAWPYDVSLDKKSLRLEPLKGDVLTVSVLPDDAIDKTVTWSSSDLSVAVVDSTGKITAVAPGRATIVATVKVTGKKATCSVAVALPSTYELSVVGGTGSGSYVRGGIVSVTADSPPAGMRFARWTAKPAIAFADPRSPMTTFAMPATGVTMTAHFESGYRLNVNNGRGSGYYEAGETVKIDTHLGIGTGLFLGFDHWSASDPRVVFSDPEAIFTSFTMPSANVTVMATFKPLHAVSVRHAVDGTHEMRGMQIRGKAVNLYVPATRLGAPFTHWTTDDRTVVFSNHRSPYTSFTMPGNDVVVTAHYEKVFSQSVLLSKTSLWLESLKSYVLTASVLPDFATDKTVTWSSGDTSVAVVDAAGKVTAIAPGRTDVTAITRDGDKTATCIVTVQKPSPLVHKISVAGGTGSGSYVRGDVVDVVADAPPVGMRFARWTAEPAAAFSDAQSPSTTFTMPAYDITVTATYEEIPVEGVSLDKTALILEPKESDFLTATVLPDDAFDKTVAWSSGDASVAVVDTGGMVTAVAPGTAEVTATTRDGGKAATCTVTVKEPPPPIYNLSVTGGTGSGSYVRGDIVDVVADAPPAGMFFARWTAEPDAGAFADVQSPATTFTMPGADVVVTAKFEKIRVESVSLDKTALTLEPKESDFLTASVLPEDAFDRYVTWSSGEASVAVVDADGMVTAVAPGTAEVTATTRDGGKAATCTVTVTPPLIRKLSVTGGTGSGDHVRGDIVDVVADAPPAGMFFARWTTEPDAGVFADVRSPSTTFTMPGADVAVTAVFEEIPVEGVSIDKTVLTLEPLKTYFLTASVLPDDAVDKHVTWTSNNIAVAVVYSDGKVYARAPGTAEITATTRDGGKTAKCTATVVAPKPAVYKLSVTGGAGSGEYVRGETVGISADAPPAGMRFVRWTTEPDAGAFADPQSPATTFTMPGADVAVTATYEEIPDPEKPESEESDSDLEKPNPKPEEPASKPETPKPTKPELGTPTKAQLGYSLAKKAYNGSAQGVTVKPKEGVGAVTAVYYNGSKAVPKNAGSYAVTVNVAEGTRYGAANGIALGTFTIARADVSKVKIAVADAVWSGRRTRPARFTYNKTSFATKTCASTVSYGANRDVGKGTVTITGKGNFTGRKTLTFKILPKRMSAPANAVAGKNQVKVSWKKSSKAQKTTGYRLRWRVVGTKTWSKEKSYKAFASSATIKGLKKGQRYEFQVRACRTVSKTSYYGAWSNIRTSAKVK